MRYLTDDMGLRRIRKSRPSVPTGQAVFAVGDIHGRVDCLVEIHKLIRQQAASLPPDVKKTVIYLGDYIDHGPNSAGVLDVFVSAPLDEFETVHLLGNHELAFLSFLKGEADFLVWLHDYHGNFDVSGKMLLNQNLLDWLYAKGGTETLKSYGINVPLDLSPERLIDLRVQLLRKIPTDHLTFLEQLKLAYSVGDFYFAHAGIDPHKPLSQQKPSDLLSIGETFLSSAVSFEKVVIHGHTPEARPAVKRNRIGLDIKAYATGILSGVMIYGEQLTFFQNEAIGD